MLSKLPSHAALRAPSLTRVARALPPLVVAVRVDPRLDVTDPATLLRECVAVTAVVHPVLDALLRQAGARPVDGAYTLQAPPGSAPSATVAAALRAAHPSVWRSGGKGTLAETFGPALMTALTASGAVPGGTRPKRLAGMALRVTRVGQRLRITPVAEELTVGGRRFGLGSQARLLLTPHDALAAVGQARAAGIVVVNADGARALADLEWLVDRSCLLRPVPAAPGWADLVTGSLVAAPAGSPLPAEAAVALTGRLKGDVAIAVDPAVAQAAAVATISAPPADPSRRRRSAGPTADAVELPATRAGLRPWQDLFVSAYLASGPGLVNALPPGSGKTVCAAAAMNERASTAPTGRYRAVVVAPVAVRGQWRHELGRFFPGAHVTSVVKNADVAGLVNDWHGDRERLVAVLTPQMLARTDAVADLTVDDLVVDEATFLRSRTSAQAEAAWRLRRRAAHAMVLTGTPAEHGEDDTAALVAYARGDRGMFDQLPLSGPHPSVPTDRVGALVFTGPHQVTGHLPQAEPRAVACTPSAAEQVVEQLARDRVRQLLGTAGDGVRRVVPQLRIELEAWRLGLTCPAALLGARYALAAQARDAGVPATLGTKGEWTVTRTQQAVLTGQQVLVFSDFPAALEAVGQRLESAGIAAGLVASSVTPRRRERSIEAFTAGTLPVLLVSATGQLGLNLQTAAVVVHLDVPTTAATLLQRSARAARLGSAHPTVEVEVPVLDGCADQALLAHLSADAPVTDLWTVAAELATGGR